MVQYIQANTSHIPLLVQSRIDFLKDYWGDQDPLVEHNLRIELESFFSREIAEGSYVAYFAMEDGVYVGVGGMKVVQRPGSFRIPEGTSGYIMNMYTKPDYRKKGIARSILEALLSLGKEMGLRFFELHATKDGEHLYQQIGFTQHQEPTYRLFTL